MENKAQPLLHVACMLHLTSPIHISSISQERLLFHLSVLRMLRLMAADGMYLPDYILAPLELPPGEERSVQRGRGSVSGGSAATGQGADTIEAISAILEGLAPIRALEAKLSGVLQASGTDTADTSLTPLTLLATSCHY